MKYLHNTLGMRAILSTPHGMCEDLSRTLHKKWIFAKSNSQSSVRSLFVGCLANILTSVKPRDAHTASGPTCSRDLEAKPQSHSLQSTVLCCPTLPNHRQLPLWAPSRARRNSCTRRYGSLPACGRRCLLEAVLGSPK